MTSEWQVKEIYPDAKCLSPEYGACLILLRPEIDLRAFAVSSRESWAWAGALRNIKDGVKP
jgi:hypothetical protein